MKLTKLLLGAAVVLILTNVLTLSKTLEYRNLYYNNPRIRTVEHSTVEYAHFDPNRSSAYSCITHAISSSGVGMVCTSPDNSIQVNCTTTSATPKEYWC